jgi:predicted porin
MNRKLLTLAVAAAVAAPTAAMAEAVLYGKLHVSIDYADVNNALGVNYDTVDGFRVDSISDVTESTLFVNNTGEAVTVGDVTVQPEGTITISEDFADVAQGQEVTLIRVDENGTPIVNRASGQDYTGWGINGRSSQGFMPGESRANRVGVKGSEDLGNGLKAIYQVEFGVQLADTNGNVASGGDNVTMRNSFVGLAGDWGTFLVGRHDTPLKISTGKLDLFADTMADYNGTVGFDDLRTDNTIAYISPSWGGFSFAGAVVAGGSATAIGQQNINEDSIAGAYSLAAIYNNGPFYVSAAYESLDQDMFMNSATSITGKGACFNADGTFRVFPTCNYIDSAYDKWRIGLGILDWNGFTLTGIYEQQENLPSGQFPTSVAFVDAETGAVATAFGQTVEKQQLWQVQAAYAFGNSQIKAMYGSVTRNNTRLFGATRDTTIAADNLRALGRSVRDDLEGDRYTWAVGFDHNFSKRSKIYALYTQVDDDLNGFPGYSGAEWEGFSLGMIHSF